MKSVCFRFYRRVFFIAAAMFLYWYNPAAASWCVSGNSNKGAITPTTTSQNTASFNPNGLVPYWSFVGTAGVTYHFSLCASANTEDAILNVYDGASPGGNLAAANDEGSCASLSSLTFICPANGTYYIAANLYPWFQFTTTNGLRLTYYVCGAAAGLTLPFTENWTTSDVITACSSWMAHGAGGEGDWYRGNPVIPGNPNSAGGTGNEAGFVGNQANLYGVGVAKTVTLTSPKLNTTSVTSLTFSWKHSLGVTNSGASGTNTITLKLQSSSDLITWTDQWTGSYTATALLTTPIWQVNQSVTFSPAGSDTWLRFYLNGVPFKVWGWLIDNGSGTGSIMPVEMLSFSGKNSDGKTFLNWTTASEKNNDYFSIECSEDAQSWREIGIVKGAGNSSIDINYRFADEFAGNRLQSQTIYYRLRQNDFDGKFDYYGPIAVSLSPEDSWKLIVQNIFQNGILNAELISKDDADALLEITDLQGRILKKETVVISKGKTDINIETSGISSGAYIMKIYNEKNFVLNRFMKL